MFGLRKSGKRSASYYKQRMKTKVTSVLALCAVIFALAYVPLGTIEWVKVWFTGWWEIAARAGLSLPVVVVGRWLIFSQDHLANGRSNASVFFRHCYASSYAVEKYHIPLSRATTMWFDYFNKWEAEEHPNHMYYRTNFERTYSLRLIYYLKRVLFCFSALAILVTMIWWWYNSWHVDTPLLIARLGLAGLSGLVAISLASSNRVGKVSNAAEYDDRYWAIGAYAKFQEISRILHVKFDDDVLSKMGLVVLPGAAPAAE